MMTYDFKLELDVDGTTEQRDFEVAARSFQDAVRSSIEQIVDETPQAQFRRLTFFHPPLPPRSYL